jgi:hypothetical protein
MLQPNLHLLTSTVTNARREGRSLTIASGGRARMKKTWNGRLWRALLVAAALGAVILSAIAETTWV